MTHVHHIGYLVKNMEKARKAFSILGYVEKQSVTYDGIRDVEIAFWEKDGYIVELVSPKSGKSVVARLMKTYKNAPYHICYETDDLLKEMDRLEHSGFTRIDEPAPAPAMGNRKVVFLISACIGIIELLEE